MRRAVILSLLMTISLTLAFEWSEPVRVSPVGANIGDTHVHISSYIWTPMTWHRSLLAVNDNYVCIAWAESLSDGRWQIKVARSTDGGFSFAQHIVRTPATDEHQIPVELQFTNGDTLILVYISDKDESEFHGKIYFAQSTNAGITWVAPDYPIQSSSSVAQDLINPSHAWFVPDFDFTEDYYVIFYTTNDGIWRTINSDDKGETWTDNYGGGSWGGIGHSIAIDSTGKMILAHPCWGGGYWGGYRVYLHGFDDLSSTAHSDIGYWGSEEMRTFWHIAYTIARNDHLFNFFATSGTSSSPTVKLICERWSYTITGDYTHNERVDVTGSRPMTSNMHNGVGAFQVCLGGLDTVFIVYAREDTTMFKVGINNMGTITGTHIFDPGYMSIGISYKNGDVYIALASIEPGSEGYSVTGFYLVRTVPPPYFTSPSISVPETSATSAVINWSDATYEESYVVSVGGGTGYSVPQDSCAIEVSGLTPNMNYTADVWGVNFRGTTDTLTTSFKTLLPTPELTSPSDSTFVGGSGSITFAWSSIGIPGAGYHLIIMDTTSTVAHSEDVFTDSATISLDEGNYLWYVSAYTSDNYSHPSDTFFLSVDLTAPELTNLGAREIGTSDSYVNPSPWSRSGYFEVNWELASPEISGLQEIWVKRGSAPTSESDADFVCSATPPDTINLTTDGEFTYYFRPVDRAGNIGDSYTLDLRRDTSPPTMASAVLPAYSYPGNAPVSWFGGVDALSGIADYNILMRQSGHVSWDTIGAYSISDIPVSVSFSEFNTYELCVVPRDNAGNTASPTTSDIEEITILPSLALSADEIKMGPSAPNIQLFWNNIGYTSVSYEIVLSSSGSVVYSSMASGTTFTFTPGILSALSGEGEYGFGVGIIYPEIAETLNPSIWGTFVFDETAPGSPINLQINGNYPYSGWTNSSDFTISWTNPYDASGIMKCCYNYSVPSSAFDTTACWEISGASPTENLTITDEGTKDIYVWLVDSAYNSGVEGYLHIYAQYDETAPADPAAHFDGSVPISTDSASFNVCWHPVSDLSGIMEYRYKLWKITAPSTYTSVIDTCTTDTIYGAGSNWKVEVIAVDSAGNTTDFTGVPDDALDWENIYEQGSSKPENISMNIIPNPFNASCKITVESAAGGEVKIYDIMGIQVASYDVRAGQSEFIWNGGNKMSGIYFVRLKAGDRTITKRAILMK